QPLAVDAVAREREGVEAPFGDRLAAALALSEAALVELPQRDQDFFEEAPVTVAQLEQELAGVGGRPLVPQILDAVVFLPLAITRASPDLILELASLVQERLAEVGEPVLLDLHARQPPLNDACHVEVGR